MSQLGGEQIKTSKDIFIMNNPDAFKRLEPMAVEHKLRS